MVKIPKSWVGKKSPSNPNKKEQHQNRKTKEDLNHRWELDDWKTQVKEYLQNANY